ncbi:AIM24 family protein [Nocardioides sp. dk4132]|uniref:AIM24 family protein n=1 Tax=unclassified Nocardioides TaxID=2615069 RepID=UPI001294FEB4|nr:MULTISPECIES: AIM24 family protein [unclassified Nocardioides]MQW76440.1 AIM24 family protein [Nocardioides sp. dk4132]QGA07291.1 AIM24 family protein [Nocardioides sp. dk884]
MRSDLFDTNLESTSDDRFALQNSKMLRVALDGEVMARQGAMVAYQGEVDFAYQGSGGMGRFLKKTLTGEGMPLMKVSGRGDVFLADDAMEIHLVRLEGDALTVNGSNVLAFDSALTWDIKRVEGASMMAGGVFNTTFTGTGTVAVTSHGTPVMLNVDAPTYADIQSAIAWSASLTTSVRRTAGAGALIGRGSGEAFQLAFSGQGFVLVQASEGRVVPSHTH